MDYNGGMVLPMAISKGITAWVAFTDDDHITIASNQFEGSLHIPINESPLKNAISWLNYPLGVLQVLQDQRAPLRGCSVLLDSNLPAGSGLSSSAALELLMATIFTHGSDFISDSIQLAKLGKQAENDFVGVQCGIMDQFAIAHGNGESAVCIDCTDLSYDFVPIDFLDHELLIINTGKPRELVDSAFNQRQAECREAAAFVYEHFKINHLAIACEDQIKSIKKANVRKRATHVINEQSRVKQAKQHLIKGELTQFGALLYASHHSLKHDFEVSCAALDYIVDFAKTRTDCLGSRMTGAGFGGCAIALVRKESSLDFQSNLTKAYSSAFNHSMDIIVCKAGMGVGEITAFG
ncbi:UNVERIFIED_CONTAM: hypothetical protein GTU68_042240 [Idotea baltica]|nr:hypothetical protein [Idotea baltica]